MKKLIPFTILTLLAVSCNFSGETITVKESDAKYVGQAVGKNGIPAANWEPLTTYLRVLTKTQPPQLKGWAWSPVSTAERLSSSAT